MQQAVVRSPGGHPVESILVQCDFCRNRAYVYQLNSGDGGVIWQYCSKCGAETSWRENQRRENRLALKMALCVRVPGNGEEVIATENISRGGLCFQSPRLYLEGSRIEAAVPYTPGSVNIFLPCEIRRVELLAAGRMIRYHAAYGR